jgi:chlorobactene glucosyltransferase
MATTLILSAILLAVAWLWLRFAKREVSLPIWSTLEIPALTENTSPFVSIIVATGDRASDLERCVPSLLRQAYARFEVIVVEGSSPERDAERILQQEATADGNLRVLRRQHLPIAWPDRPAALQQGGEVARGDWLLFTTAESYHAPTLLGRAMAYARWRELDLLSLAPRYECRSFWEHVWQPTAFQYFAFIRPMEQVGEAADRGVWASEAFLLVSREAYDKAGGHAAVASDLDAAGAFMRRVKAPGHRVEFVKAMDLLQTRTYRNLGELWDGWSRCLYVLLGGRPIRVIAHTLGLMIWAVLPFVALIPAFSFGFWGLDRLHGWWEVVFAVSAILAVVTILQAESVVRRVHRQNHFYTATLPLGGLCLAAAAMKGLLQAAAWRRPAVQGTTRSDTALVRSKEPLS